MRTRTNRLQLLLLLTLLVVPTWSLAADDEDRASTFEFTTQASYSDNIFRNEDARGETADSLFLARLGYEYEKRLRNGMRLTPFVEAGGVIYQDTDDANYFFGTAGLEWRAGGHRLEASVSHSPERLLFIRSGGETVDYEVRQARMRYRTDLTSWALLDLDVRYTEDEYDPVDAERTNEEWRYEAGIEFKVSRALRIGVSYRFDDVTATIDNYSRERDRYALELGGDLGERWGYLIRFRERETEFLGTDPERSNFERDDERTEVFGELQYALRDGWKLRASIYSVDATSSREDRNFDAIDASFASIWTF